MRARVAAACDIVATLVLVAWVGGQAALGAFAARIAFSVLPREDAARTMTRVFHEFDYVIATGVALVLACAVLGLWAQRRWAVVGLRLALAGLGLFEVLHVHAQIEALYHAGETLTPRFAALHALSERCAHLEAFLAVVLVSLALWPRKDTSTT